MRGVHYRYDGTWDLGSVYPWNTHTAHLLFTATVSLTGMSRISSAWWQARDPGKSQRPSSKAAWRQNSLFREGSQGFSPFLEALC